MHRQRNRENHFVHGLKYDSLKEILNTFETILKKEGKLPLSFQQQFNILIGNFGSVLKDAGVYNYLNEDTKPWTLDLVRQAADSVRAEMDKEAEISMATRTPPMNRSGSKEETILNKNGNPETPDVVQKHNSANFETARRRWEEEAASKSPTTELRRPKPIQLTTPVKSAMFVEAKPQSIPSSPVLPNPRTKLDFESTRQRFHVRGHSSEQDTPPMTPRESIADITRIVKSIRFDLKKETWIPQPKARKRKKTPYSPSSLSEVLTLEKFGLVKPRIGPTKGSEENLELDMPYAIQKIKSWGFEALVVEAMSFNNMDLFIKLIRSSDNDVLGDIWKILARFHVALPLLVPAQGNQKFTFMGPTLKNCVIQWKASSQGKTLTNFLFNDPFILVVTLTVGSLLEPIYLNSVLQSENGHFSSRASEESNSFVEFTWITEEVCSELFWHHLKEKRVYSESDEFENRLILLANVSGDIFHNPEILQVLKEYASAFLIFVMPEAQPQYEHVQKEFAKLLRGNKQAPVVKWCIVDPTSEISAPSDAFVLQSLTMVSQKGKLSLVRALCSVIADAIRFPPHHDFILKTHINGIDASINASEQLAIDSVQNFLGYLSSYEMDKLLSLIGVTKSMSMSYQSWEIPLYKSLIEKFVDILWIEDGRSRLYALNVLEQELNRLGKRKQTKQQAELDRFQSNRVLLAERGDNRKLEELETTISNLHKERRQTLENKHFFREVGRLYEASQAFPQDRTLTPFQSLPSKFAELVLKGQVVELLDSGLSEISITWLNAIFNEICLQAENQDLRIFVLSILGIQSSGKSTLLNALFGCKFPEAVGPCTSGLFLRVLHLEKEFQDTYNVDMIVLIDTEGLGSPEKLGTEFAEQDRLISTFAMCISDLTLINILGQNTADMMGILEIVIVTLARLDVVNISPNILLVQHLSTKNEDEVRGGIDRFCITLNETIKIIDERRDQFVIQNRRSLDVLQQNIRSGKNFKVFGNFKSKGLDFAGPSRKYHENVEELYDNILDLVAAKASSGYRSFRVWSKYLDDYWNAVKSDNFVRRFRNIKEMSDFLERNHQCMILKGLIDTAFRSHVKKLTKLLNSISFQITNLDCNGKESQDSIRRGETAVKEILGMIPDACEEDCNRCTNVVAKIKQLFKDPGSNPNMFDSQLESSVESYIHQRRETFSKQLLAHFASKRLTDIQGAEPHLLAIFNPAIEQVLSAEGGAEEISNRPNVEAHIESLVDRVISTTQSKLKEMYPEATIVERLKDDVRKEYSGAGFPDPLVRKLMECVVAIDEIKDPNWLSIAKDELLARDAFETKVGKSFLRFVTGKPKSLQPLLPAHMDFLESKLVALPSMIRDERQGVDRFEEGMIRDLKEKIGNVIKELEKKAKTPLRQNFKYELTTFAIRIFSEQIQILEAEWSMKNQPFRLLEVRKEYFRKKIRLRLLPEHSLERRGQYIASQLLNSIKNYVNSCLVKHNSEKVLQQKWVREVDVIRQRYFVELAVEVSTGKLERALNHFRHPKSAITDWFLGKLDETSYEINRQFFTEVIASFLLNMNSVSTFEDFCLATAYFLREEILAQYRQLPSSGIKKMIEIISQVISERAEAKFNEITLERPSEDKLLQSLLGCTAFCPWCGAICWGHKGHEAEFGTMSLKHHSCHQPRGLGGCVDQTTGELVPTPCEFRKLEDGEKMEEIVQRDPDWNQYREFEETNTWVYTPHPKKQLQDLMKWFYFKLMHKLAEEHGVKVSSDKSLAAAGYTRKVLSTTNVREMINGLQNY